MMLTRPTLRVSPPARSRTPARETWRIGGWFLLPVEVVPEVLAVNSDFDEGDTTESHAAKPDCANGTLKAKKDYLDGKWQEGNIVTEDLHKGFFGLRPGILPYTETAGAVVKIKKLDKNDPETNRKQSGQVRLYAVWGSQGSESEMKIELYDKYSLVANDIGPQLYHQNPNTPVTFYLEGASRARSPWSSATRKAPPASSTSKSSSSPRRRLVRNGARRSSIKSGCKNLHSARRIPIPTSPKSIQH
jgi:hypothetical protein